MSLIVKICGLSTRETLDVALDAGADMVGFMFFPPSPRHLSLGVAEELGRRVKGSARKVAITVDADDTALENCIEAVRPDLLQLHGKETFARVRDVKARFRLPVMKVISVETKSDLANVAGYAAVADRILFDARAPKDATRPGGLKAANVGEAVRVTGAPGVDTSSGVESAPGVKDPEKIRAFIRAARAVDTAKTKLVGG
jgi:phosphoribosylanthranilate isomerase